MCNHDNEGIISYINLDGIKRKTLRCAACGELWDYVPQYNEDSDIRK